VITNWGTLGGTATLEILSSGAPPQANTTFDLIEAGDQIFGDFASFLIDPTLSITLKISNDKKAYEMVT
jgi:hypothetical protein